MLRAAFSIFAFSLATGALAQGVGPAPTRSDMSPAAPTSTTGPDAGQDYHYPPSTGAILPPGSRTPYDAPPSQTETRPNDPVPRSGTGTGAPAPR